MAAWTRRERAAHDVLRVRRRRRRGRCHRLLRRPPADDPVRAGPRQRAARPRPRHLLGLDPDQARIRYRAGCGGDRGEPACTTRRPRCWRRLRRNGLAALPRSSTWLTGIVNIVEAAASLGDAELAVEAYSLLEPYADRPVMPSLAVACFGVVERALGLAALTFGDAELAVRRLEQAVEGNIRLGNRPLTAMSRADLAEALVVRGHAGDRSAAVDALRRAAEAAAVMAMPTSRRALGAASRRAVGRHRREPGGGRGATA